MKLKEEQLNRIIFSFDKDLPEWLIETINKQVTLTLIGYIVIIFILLIVGILLIKYLQKQIESEEFDQDDRKLLKLGKFCVSLILFLTILVIGSDIINMYYNPIFWIIKNYFKN